LAGAVALAKKFLKNQNFGDNFSGQEHEGRVSIIDTKSVSEAEQLLRLQKSPFAR
jgi:hypothetical protein